MGEVLGCLSSAHLGMKSNMAPTFSPQQGYSDPRPLRENKVLSEALVSARIPLKFRDYCGQHLLDYQVCRKRHFPFLVKCHHQKHEYLHCELHDYVLRMKEFERERRLREREIRIKEKGGKK